jgi:alanyl-tRNA synthetase
MTGSEIRQSFLDYFKKLDHTIVKSAPVAPLDDPTLLFTNAGMNQFKDVFLNTGTRPYTRAVDSQKCIRVSGKHNDLEEVGHDTYHHTFFEMLGNWSFGDYYKEEAIGWAWELLTKVWGLPKEKLYATVFREDDEAEALWKKVTDVHPSRVLRFDEKDNFWEMGATGPCGPCSEIHIDRGEGYCDKQHQPGHVCGVNTGCARFIEIWNLVFIQYNRDERGVLHPLPARHVDTGMGFERAAAVLQGKTSNYDTDLFTPILAELSAISGKDYDDPALKPPFRVIADHLRALSFAITDGVQPSNEGRGYVLRRLLRRAARYGRNLDLKEPFIYKLIPTLADVMGKAYPELNERIKHTTTVIRAEEERFNEVLDRGLDIFEKLAKDASRQSKTIAGADAFRLYDTFGFPLDLTQLMARERGLTVDESGFEHEMNAQRKRARESHKFEMGESGEWDILSQGADSEFVGYEFLEIDTEIRKVKTQELGVVLLLAQTPFYAESGGQVADTGEIAGKGFRLQVTDVRKQGDQILHFSKFAEGNSISDPKVTVSVKRDKRLSTARNHTATHLLHKALKEVLGAHVNQAGSLVTPARLRFDFTHHEGLSAKQVDEIEWRVNAQIRSDHAVGKEVKSYSDAIDQGATALFGEKYGDEVRVIKIEDYSMELCGGTHVDRTGEIGCFRILSEESVAAGVRRIEAITGEGAELYARKEAHLIRDASALLKCRPDEIQDRIQALLDSRRELERDLKKARQSSTQSDVDGLMEHVQAVESIPLVVHEVHVSSVDELRTLGDKLREKLKSGVGVLGAVLEDKVQILCVVTDDLIQAKNLKAGDIVREVAKLVEGGGGGKPHLALAGGKRADQLSTALAAVPGILKKQIKVNPQNG